MSSNPHQDDFENENFVMISGKIDNFYDHSSANKPPNHNDDIYDLSSLPPETNKPFINESDPQFQKENQITFNNEVLQDHFVDSFRNLKEQKEEKKNEKKEEISLNKKNSIHLKKTPSLSVSQMIENQSPPKNEKLIKRIESMNSSPINKAPFDFQPIIRTLQKTSDNLDKLIKGTEMAKKEDERKKTLIELKPHEQEESSQNEEKITQMKEKEQKEEAENDEKNKNDYENKVDSNEIMKQNQIEEEKKQERKKEKREERKKETEEKKKEKKSKKKKKSNKNKKNENKEAPPIISVGIPINADDFFDGISNNESPDLLIRLF